MNNPVANPVLNAAFRRAFMLSVLTGAVTALTARQQDQTWEDCLIAGIIVLLTTLIAWTGFEGGFDANRALNNNVNRAMFQWLRLASRLASKGPGPAAYYIRGFALPRRSKALSLTAREGVPQ